MAVYTTSTAVEKLLSSDGVDLRTDDDPTAVDDAIAEASRVEIDESLLPQYRAADLAGNAWVEYACRAVAAFLLCERRGNPVPASTQARYERYAEKLTAVRLGQLGVPGLARVRQDVPTLASPRTRLSPLGARQVIDRRRGPVRNPPQDYSPANDIFEPFDPTI